MILRFHEAAHDDLVLALAWYLERSERASDRFLIAFRAAMVQASEFPNSGALTERGLRRFQIRGYPYFLYVDPITGLMIAVSHASQRQDHFLSRLDSDPT